MMRLLFIISCLSFHIIYGDDAAPAPYQQKVYTLCLDIHQVTMKDMTWDSGSTSKWAKTEGIVYVYDPEAAKETFKSLTFPINTIEAESDDASLTLPTEFTFSDDEQTIGCWNEPDFHELNIRFKLYQLYHTALKAVSIVEIPSIASHKESTEITLNTLPYQYSDANIQILYTLRWETQYITVSSPLIKPTISIIPVSPPVSAESAFESDEITDQLMKGIYILYRPSLHRLYCL